MRYSTCAQKFPGTRASALGRYGMLLTVIGVLLAGTTLLLAQEPPAKPTDPLQPVPPVEKTVEKADKGLPVKVTATVDKKTYKAGDPIKMTLTVKNMAEEPVALRFSNGQRFDFVLREGTKPTGKIVWQWARGHMFTMMVTSQKLEPGKPLTFTAAYPPPSSETPGKAITPLAAGTYTLTGTLTTMGTTPRAFGVTLLTITAP